MRELTIYGRPGCHLCSDALSILVRLQEEGREFEIVEVDIESDPQLHIRYLERIPVIEVDGNVVSELVPSVDTLRQTLDTLGT